MREPQQERGQRRVEAILDAAAVLIVERGVDGVTVAALAERASTSKGSLYHFFPDRESVFRALAQRHLAGLHEVVASIRSDTLTDWRGAEDADVVDGMLSPFRAYVDANPELLVMMREPAGDGATNTRSELLAALRDAVREVLAVRYPDAGVSGNALRASTMVAIIDGISATARRLDEPQRSSMQLEMRRALAGYLRALGAPCAPVLATTVVASAST